MAGELLGHAWTGPGQTTVKRRKISAADQDRLQGFASWLPATNHWSPNDSSNSSGTLYASPDSIQYSPHRLDSVPSLERPTQLHSTLPTSSWLDTDACSTFYTPPAQGIDLPRQHAPKILFSRVPAEHTAPATQSSEWRCSSGVQPSLPLVGAKRLHLDSYTIANQLAAGQGHRLSSSQGAQRPSERIILARTRPLPTARSLPANPAGLQQPNHFFGSTGVVLEPVLQNPTQRFLPGSKPAFPAAALCKNAVTQRLATHMPARSIAACQGHTAVVRGGGTHLEQSHPGSGLGGVYRAFLLPLKLLEQWAFALSFKPDTVRLTAHMFDRVESQVRRTRLQASGAQRTLLLLGCLWVAAKHEECRFGMPGAQKIGALLADGVQGGASPVMVNRVELLVLDLLGWRPLQGWDDLRFVKGKPRDLREVSELCWLSCSV